MAHSRQGITDVPSPSRSAAGSWPACPWAPTATRPLSAPSHGVSQFRYAENWEDMEGFEQNMYVSIPDQAFAVWSDAISGQAFARGETYGFRYIDYYTALMTTRGCLAGTSRACAFVAQGGAPLTSL